MTNKRIKKKWLKQSEEYLSPESQQAVSEMLHDLATEQQTGKTFDSIADLMADLEKDDDDDQTS